MSKKYQQPYLTPLPRQNLLNNKFRVIMSIGGISGSIMLIFFQLGMYSAVLDNSLRIYNRIEFDLALVSPNYLYLRRTGTFPRQRLFQSYAIPEVQKASPLYVGTNNWRSGKDARQWPILMMGINPKDNLFDIAEINKNSSLLQKPYIAMADTIFFHMFGPVETGESTEIGGYSFKIVSKYTMGIGFASKATVLMSDKNFANVFPNVSIDDVSIGFLRLRKNTDVLQVKQMLEKVLPEDVRILTRKQLNNLEMSYWKRFSPSGLVFMCGVIMATIVVTVILYQLLSSEISNNLSQYATLKAIGYSNWGLIVIVVQQFLLLLLVSFLPGILLALAVYGRLEKKLNMDITMTPERIIGVGVLLVFTCLVASMFSVNRIIKADPADVF